MLAGRAEPGRDQDGTELVTVQGSRMGLVVQPRPTDVRRGRVPEELFFDRVRVEPSDGALPPGDCGAGTAGASSSRAKVSMSARRTENSESDRALHQPLNWRRSRV